MRLFYEVYGDGEPTVLLLPPWSIVHSRIWKAQIPYLARHFRVVVFDARGNGKSGRPADPGLYAIRELAADALAILDETATERAVLVVAVARSTAGAAAGGRARPSGCCPRSSSRPRRR